MRRARIGFVFQRFNLLPTLTAEGNIEIAHEIAGKKGPLDRELMHRLAGMLGISGRLDHRPAELSGGEQQRVAIARALIARPAILLADEPTGNLDTKNSEAVLNMLRESSRELGQTVMMITHNPEAAQIGDRVVVYPGWRDGGRGAAPVAKYCRCASRPEREVQVAGGGRKFDLYCARYYSGYEERE